jgi:hypothetical protein
VGLASRSWGFLQLCVAFKNKHTMKHGQPCLGQYEVNGAEVYHKKQLNLAECWKGNAKEKST